MRIATYNLFEGAQNTLPLIQDFTRQQNIDVLCVQEANSWNDNSNSQPSKLETFASNTDLNYYVYGDSNTRFKLATLSKIPILHAQVHTEGFWHSAIQTTLRLGARTIDIWNVHLNPGDEDSRLAEAKLLTATIDTTAHAMIMGDFNSLSGADHYPDEFLATLTLQGIKKFGADRLRYDVTNYFINQGFVDLAAVHGKQRATVPTHANKDMYHAADMRLDYMFATASIAKLVKEVDVPKDTLTDRISDHYPIVLTLKD